MSAGQQIIGRAATPYGNATILVGRYPVGGAIAVQLVADDESSEPMATFSTNLVHRGAQLSSNEFCVKTWSENEVFVAPMFLSGLFVDTGRRVPTGYVVAPIWRIKDPAHVPPARRRSAMGLASEFPQHQFREAPSSCPPVSKRSTS
jgi:hypothetical protein